MSDILQWTMKQVAHPITGVLHIGANSGQEARAYAQAGLKVVWIEGDPKLMPSLLREISPYPSQTALQCLAADVDDQEVDFNIASNDGGSSSVLKPNTDLFAEIWPGVEMVALVKLKTRRLDTLLSGAEATLSGVNLVLADVQGYELPVLRGLGQLLDRFEAVVAEVNWATMYRGATKPQELEAFLVSRGFRRAWLGLSDCQATGVWIRQSAGWLRRAVMAATVRGYALVVHLGLMRAVRSAGGLDLLRQIYSHFKRR